MSCKKWKRSHRKEGWKKRNQEEEGDDWDQDRVEEDSPAYDVWKGETDCLTYPDCLPQNLECPWEMLDLGKEFRDVLKP